jgi:hypothetical protein
MNPPNPDDVLMPRDRDPPTNPENGDQYLDDPYLQPLEGGYYQCTLCSATLPGLYHVSGHVQGKTHKRRLANSTTPAAEEGYLDQYAGQFFDAEVELTFGVVDKESAPAHAAEEMKCELCETILYGWDQWLAHFKSKKHIKARRNCEHRMMWQCLHADFPYYYEHITAFWQTSPPKHGQAIRDGKVIILPPHPAHLEAA